VIYNIKTTARFLQPQNVAMPNRGQLEAPPTGDTTLAPPPAEVPAGALTAATAAVTTMGAAALLKWAVIGLAVVAGIVLAFRYLRRK
jgi:hypothetical protein